ncbi:MULTISPECIES: hypothetical protein [unclassified Streptomyces]|uniref:hypothetical protein n=1 Tax=unclassified Streptomyces TaxID=2593676 RepID=UPI00344B9925
MCFTSRNTRADPSSSAAPFAIWLILALLGAAMGQAVGAVSSLMYLVGAGILFAAGFYTARMLLDLSQQ